MVFCNIINMSVRSLANSYPAVSLGLLRNALSQYNMLNHQNETKLNPVFIFHQFSHTLLLSHNVAPRQVRLFGGVKTHRQTTGRRRQFIDRVKKDVSSPTTDQLWQLVNRARDGDNWSTYLMERELS